MALRRTIIFAFLMLGGALLALADQPPAARLTMDAAQSVREDAGAVAVTLHLSQAQSTTVTVSLSVLEITAHKFVHFTGAGDFLLEIPAGGNGNFSYSPGFIYLHKLSITKDSQGNGGNLPANSTNLLPKGSLTTLYGNYQLGALNSNYKWTSSGNIVFIDDYGYPQKRSQQVDVDSAFAPLFSVGPSEPSFLYFPSSC